MSELRKKFFSFSFCSFFALVESLEKYNRAREKKSEWGKKEEKYQKHILLLRTQRRNP